MTDALLLGQTLLSLLEDSRTQSTYKPALMLAILDEVQARPDADAIAVRALAERVIERFWPQTRPYPDGGLVLRQVKGGHAGPIVGALLDLRAATGATAATPLAAVRGGAPYGRAVDAVELTLAEMPVRHLQHRYEDVLYTFDWPGPEQGFTRGSYRASSRSLRLQPGVADALVPLAPLLRPFVVRWWTEQAARINADKLRDAHAMRAFEDFLFGATRQALARLREPLLDLQRGACLFCGTRIGRGAHVDHFVPWSVTGDDGLDNLAASCSSCNLGKGALLAGARHVESLVARNVTYDGDLRSLGEERRWPRDEERSAALRRTAYLRSPDARPLWTPEGVVPLGRARAALEALLAA